MKALKDLNLLDDFLFNSVVSYPEMGEEFGRELLKIIFGREFGKLSIVPQKIYYGVDTQYHGIRLDVQLEEVLSEQGTVFDIEPEKDLNDKNTLPQRTRFYHARIDAKSLKAGEGYENLRKVVIIMIMPFDPFGYNHMIYTVRRKCEEIPEMKYDDGAMTLFLYTKGTKGNPPEALVQFLHYMEKTEAINATNEQLQKMHRIVEFVKQDTEVSTGYMKMCEYEQKWKNEGREEGTLQTLFMLVEEGVINMQYALKKADVSEKDFLEAMEKWKLEKSSRNTLMVE